MLAACSARCSRGLLARAPCHFRSRRPRQRLNCPALLAFQLWPAAGSVAELQYVSARPSLSSKTGGGWTNQRRTETSFSYQESAACPAAAGSRRNAPSRGCHHHRLFLPHTPLRPRHLGPGDLHSTWSCSCTQIDESSSSVYAQQCVRPALPRTYGRCANAPQHQHSILLSMAAAPSTHSLAPTAWRTREVPAAAAADAKRVWYRGPTRAEQAPAKALAFHSQHAVKRTCAPGMARPASLSRKGIRARQRAHVRCIVSGSSAQRRPSQRSVQRACQCERRVVKSRGTACTRARQGRHHKMRATAIHISTHVRRNTSAPHHAHTNKSLRRHERREITPPKTPQEHGRDCRRCTPTAP